MPEEKPKPSIWEIERKFLVAAVPPDLDRYPHETIHQGYLAWTEDGTEVRVRRKGDRCFQAIKKGEGVRRLEVEIALSDAQFDVLWPLTQGRRVEKERYAIALREHTLELDVYRGTLAGLVSVEVEFPSMAASRVFQPPPWFGPEITGDPRFKNRNLAVRGVPADG